MLFRACVLIGMSIKYDNVHKMPSSVPETFIAVQIYLVPKSRRKRVFIIVARKMIIAFLVSDPI